MRARWKGVLIGAVFVLAALWAVPPLTLRQTPDFWAMDFKDMTAAQARVVLGPPDHVGGITWPNDAGPFEDGARPIELGEVPDEAQTILFYEAWAEGIPFAGHLWFARVLTLAYPPRGRDPSRAVHGHPIETHAQVAFFWWVEAQDLRFLNWRRGFKGI